MVCSTCGAAGIYHAWESRHCRPCGHVPAALPRAMRPGMLPYGMLDGGSAAHSVEPDASFGACGSNDVHGPTLRDALGAAVPGSPSRAGSRRAQTGRGAGTPRPVRSSLCCCPRGHAPPRRGQTSCRLVAAPTALASPATVTDGAAQGGGPTEIAPFGPGPDGHRLPVPRPNRRHVILGPPARALRKVETLVGRFVDLRNGCCDRRGTGRPTLVADALQQSSLDYPGLPATGLGDGLRVLGVEQFYNFSAA